jgi:periplasmic divalent cation tolerance protein
VLSTISEASAEEFVRDLVERRLIACGNIAPGVTSIYRWNGTMMQDKEAMLWMETTAERVPALRSAFEDAHPYDVCKFVVLTPSESSEAFAAWVAEATLRESSS